VRDESGVEEGIPNMKILMVEDDAATVESVRLSLEIYLPTITLEATDSGQEALQKLSQDNYNGVLVDLGLPDIDGIELIEKIRSFSQVPVVVLSARNNPEVISQTLKLGANGYVTKPYDCWNLLKLLDNKIKKDYPATKK
jgi:DNA-binding response OmpR family regulator